MISNNRQRWPEMQRGPIMSAPSSVNSASFPTRCCENRREGCKSPSPYWSYWPVLCGQVTSSAIDPLLTESFPGVSFTPDLTVRLFGTPDQFWDEIYHGDEVVIVAIRAGNYQRPIGLVLGKRFFT